VLQFPSFEVVERREKSACVGSRLLVVMRLLEPVGLDASSSIIRGLDFFDA